MALATYADLQDSILNWLGRPGDITVPVDDIVALFEADASTRLRTHYQETNTLLYTIANTTTYELPDDFMEMREVSCISTTPTFVLEYLTPAQMDDTYIDQYPSEPLNYTLEGTTIRFAPLPDGQYTIRIEYFQAIPSLADNSFSATSI